MGLSVSHDKTEPEYFKKSNTVPSNAVSLRL